MVYFKKTWKVTPIIVLSTSILFSPVCTFAAETSSSVQANSIASQGNVIQGYLFKNGVKTPVYKKSGISNKSMQLDATPYPELSSNPNDPILEKGSSITESGNIGSILYFSRAPFTINDQNQNLYLEKSADNKKVTAGKYDPSTLQKTPEFSFSAESFSPENYQDFMSFFDGTTVKRETAFHKLGSGVVPKTGAYTFSQAVTSGLSTADAIGGSLTLGYKISIKAGGGVIPAETTNEFSSQLTASYNHTITVSNQVTNTQTLSNPKAPDTYQYDKYVGAVYQLCSKYTVLPGSALSKEISAGKAILAQTAFSYDDSTLYLAVTPGAGS
ncbi:hypothetical protein [Bacillus toyonensis]|uniref:hypothetical protein n=1 Tax=Bacillus toyonensis TaxID=155322 RepID=UPI0015D4A1AE|nr:hypothetical protein [Bacillus toyonensis]